jgi:hypothetical protein
VGKASAARRRLAREKMEAHLRIPEDVDQRSELMSITIPK